MRHKKRTTVTTIETHEVWTIRRAVPEPPNEAVTTDLEDTEPDMAVSPSSAFNNASERSNEQESEETESCIDEA